jgi:NDP-sugar pyrophosphorylase family protein
VNSGIYLLDRRLLAAIPSRRMVSLEREVLPGVKRLYAMKGIYPFIDLGTPESYARAEAFFEPGN